MDTSKYLDNMARTLGVVSLENARKLEDAGLSQSIGAGDYGYIEYKNRGNQAVFLVLFNNCFEFLNEINKGNTVIKAPKLDQLLAEIEKRLPLWLWVLSKEPTGAYNLGLWEHSSHCVCEFTANTPKEAAADALIWILGHTEEAPNMKFYYENTMGDTGIFSETDLIRAIYAAWNIEASLYILGSGVKKLIFAPWESNEFNSDLLKEYGYYMDDGDHVREIKDTKSGQVIKYEWSEVKQLFV